MLLSDDATGALVTWPYVRFAEICAHSAFGPRFSGELYSSSGNVATLRTTDIDERRGINYLTMPLATIAPGAFDQHFLRRGDLVITRSGRVGTTAVFEGFDLPVLPGAFLIRFRLKEAVANPHFVDYFFKSPQGQSLIASVTTGSVQQNVNITNLHELRVPLPSLKEQEAVAGLLKTLDDKIDLNRRTNEALDAMARALFRSWFVDFDPVRAKAEGRAPVGMDAATATLFPCELVSSDFGDLPSGWRIAPVGDVVRAVGGSTPRTSEPKFWDGQYHWARPKDLSGLEAPILLRTERTITEEGLRLISSGLLPAGTVLLSSRAPIGYLAITNVPVAVNQGFIAMVCDGLVPNHYVLHWCRENMPTIEARASGTTFPEISKAAFRPIPMLVPHPAVLTAWESLVGPLYDRVRANLEESRTLAELRDLLLPKLLSGELRVRDAEKLVGQVA